MEKKNMKRLAAVAILGLSTWGFVNGCTPRNRIKRLECRQMLHKEFMFHQVCMMNIMPFYQEA
jgi:hypothetical protein